MSVNPHAFTSMLNQMRRGQSAEELSEILAEAQDAVRETGKAAKITYTLTLKPEKGMPGMFMLTDDIKAKLPSMDRGATVMFENGDMQLQLEDPRQQSLELKQVEEAPRTMRTVPDEEKPSTVRKVK